MTDLLRNSPFCKKGFFDMGLETFPEIENFQKLPRQVIVKAGQTSVDPVDGARLNGIVINNSGHGIRDLKANIVVFDEKKIPVLNTSIKTDPDALPQGGMASFTFQLKDYKAKFPDYYLYTNWAFDNQD